MQLRSFLPGRLRWSIDELQNNDLLAKKIEISLRQLKAVTEVKANPTTGRLLVSYSGKTSEQAAADHCAKAIHDPYVSNIQTTILPLLQQGYPIPAGSSKTNDNPLSTLIRSVESDKSLRWKATGFSVFKRVLSLGRNMSLAGIIASVFNGGGIAFLARAGLGPVGQLGLFAGLFLIIRTLEAYAIYEGSSLWQKYATDIEHNLRQKTFNHIEHQDMNSLETQNSNQMISLIHDDAVNIRRYLGSVPDSFISKGAGMVLAGLIFLLITPLNLVLALLPAPFVYLISRKYQDKITTNYMLQGESEGFVRKHLSNNVSGLPVVKSYTAENYEQLKLEKASLVLRESTCEAHSAGVKHSELTSYAIGLGTMLPVLYGGYRVIQGTLSIPMYMLQSFLVPEISMSLAGVDHEYSSYQSAKSSARRIVNLLSHEPEIISGDQPLPLEGVRGDIQFKHISFAYQESHKIFDDFDIHIPAHQSVALIGSTGSGKSTLLKLLLRFYGVDDGEIILDGHNINDLDVGDLRKAISLVSQEVFMFEGTIYENILYGRPDADREAVIAAAEAAEALGFIEVLPHGFDTVLGERGVNLSGGQRQRLSIARAILKDSPILIMDEATSAVDNETEGAIQRSIAHISSERTTIIVAHRLSTIRHVDQIYLLNNGRVEEQGNHEELLALDGTYAALWKLQTGERDYRQ